MHDITRWTRRAVLTMAGVAALAVPAMAQSDKPIRIGIPASIQNQLGKDIRDGAQLAIDEINAAGGVLGQQIEAIVEDGASDPPTFAQKAPGQPCIRHDNPACRNRPGNPQRR